MSYADFKLTLPINALLRHYPAGASRFQSTIVLAKNTSLETADEPNQLSQQDSGQGQQRLAPQ
jgi:hypothetical protein